MKVLLFTFGSRGDVQPYVALGTALKKLGHEVTLCSSAGHESLIETFGLDYAPLPINYRELIKQPTAMEAFRSVAGKFAAMREFKGLITAQYDEMWEVAQALHPDIIVYHPRAFPAQYIAEALRVVAVPSTLQPAFVPTGERPNPLLQLPHLGWLGNRLSHDLLDRLIFWAQGTLLGKWRQNRLGLSGKPGNFFEGYDPQGRLRQRLHAYSRYLAPPPDDWTERERITGYWFLDRASHYQPPPALEAFLAMGPPPVYVGFGSMPSDNPKKQTKIVVEGLRKAGVRGVLATGWGGLEASSMADMFCLEAVPHDWLFQRCSAVVHHGGAGTTHEGLRWGRPTVICPVGVDQPYWGKRVQALGAGPKILPIRSLTPNALAKAIEATRGWNMISRSAEIATAIGLEAGADDAAAMIDTMGI